MLLKSYPSADRPLKLLLAAPLPPPDHGGIVTWSRLVRKELACRGDLELNFIDTMVRYRAATNQSLALRLTGGSAQALRDLNRLAGVLRREPPDVFHLCTTGGLATPKDFLMLRAVRRSGVPGVLHYHMGRLPEITTRGGLQWQLLRRTLALAEAVVVLDRQSEDALRAAMPEQRIVKLPNLVDLAAIDALRQSQSARPHTPAALRIVYAGHVIPAKGMRELVAACASLKEHALELALVGPAETKFIRELQCLSAARGEGRWLRCLGPVEHDESLRRIAQADVFVLPSHTEGMPNVILEAMACGRTIVGTYVGAVPEMLDIGGTEQCGLCVPPRDAASLAAALRRLAESPALRAALARRARLRAERHYAAPLGGEKLVQLWHSIAQIKTKYPAIRRAA